MSPIVRVPSTRWLAFGGLAVLAGAACSRPPEAKAPGRPRIALVMKSLANEFFLSMEKGARDHQAKNAPRYELLAGGIKDELDVNAQASLVEQMVAQKAGRWWPPASGRSAPGWWW